MMHRQRRGERGFTLIEVILVIVLLGILAAVAVNVITNAASQARFDETRKEMESLRMAIIGNADLVNEGIRSDFGFVGDIGRLPATLEELVNQGSLPAWDSTTGMGWHGPYIQVNFQENPDDYKKDAWGNAYTYASATGVITSLGADGAAGGGGFDADFSTNDLTSPTDERVGTITGRVADTLGNPLANTASVTVTVRVYYPVNGASTSTTTNTSADGYYTFNNIIIGRRKVEVSVAQGASTTTYPSKVALVTSTTPAKLDFQIPIDTTIPDAPTGLAAIRAGLDQINLTWTAPSTNTDGSPLRDLAGYNIYRSSTTPLTPSASNLLAHVGLVTRYSDRELPPAITYYYQVRAVDKADNESASSSEVTRTPNPISQTVACTSSDGGRCLSFTIKNNGAAGDNIAVSTMTVSWTGGGGAVVRRIYSPAGTQIWPAAGSGSAANGTTITLSSPFTLNGQASTTMEIRWSNAMNTGNNIWVRYNSIDGYLNLY
ncbi:MAG: prepilin-type N-terminal cleavage/methylation domain-containing protein [candidate division NC10 bacterium]|nr:prepilin-type N-terminal cleavage/methylation domain-containing protein [candidate division NC10 bacterium]